MAAARRNGLPAGFLLPSVQPPLLHTVSMDERGGFEVRETLDYGTPELRGVLLKEVDGMLLVELAPPSWGAPPRARLPLTLRLAPGEWARWLVNYRLGGYCDGWRYYLDILNLAYAPVAADAFLGSPTASWTSVPSCA
jgi:hypothetical protein